MVTGGPGTRAHWHAYAWVVAGAVALSACGRTDEPTVTAETGALTVSAQAARIETLRDAANASGLVVPSTLGEWTVIAPEVAQIVELPKKALDPVTVGDLLVRFEMPSVTQELSALELAVLEASSHLERVRSELGRQTTLFERGITSRNAYDNARLDVSTGEVALLQARTRFDAAKASDNRSVVRATFSGVITEVFHNEGDAVRPTEADPILRVIDPSRVQVVIDLPLAQLARVVSGQTATVQAIAAPTSEAATVVSKTDAVATGAPTGQARLSFVNTPTLAVNTPVSVEVLLDQRTNALVVPSSALQRDELGWYLMVAGDDGRAHRRDVRIGLVTAALTQVSTGLSAGEMVITSSLSDVKEGTPIVVAR